MRMVFALVIMLLGAWPAASASPEAARRLVEIAGVAAMLDSLDRSLRVPPPEVAGDRTPLAEHWAEAAERHLRLSDLIGDLVDGVAASLPDTDAEGLAAYYSAGLGLRVTEMEKAAQAGMERPERVAEGREIMARMVDDDPARVDVLKALEARFDAVESGTAMALNMSFAMVSGMVASGRLPAKMSDAELLALIQRTAPAVRASVTDQFYSAAALTYRDLPTAELRTYVDFLGTPPARAFYAAINSTLERVLEERMRAFGHEIMLLSGARKI
jgi:hypothetical protein